MSTNSNSSFLANAPQKVSTFASDNAARLVYLLVFAVPVIFAAPPGQRPLQLAAYSLLCFLMAAAWVLSAGQKVDLQQLKRTALTGPNLAILAFVVSGLVSVLVSINPFYSQFAAVQLVTGALIYGTLVYRFRRPDQIRTLLYSLAALGILVVLAALLLDRGAAGLQLAGTFHDRQLLGAFLCLLLPVFAGLAAGTKHRGWKIAAQVAGVLVAGALLLTGCRSAWLGATFGLLVFAGLAVAFVCKRNAWWGQKHNLIVTPLLALVALALFMGYSGMTPAMRARAATIGVAKTDPSFQDRLNMWQVATQVIAARPGAGWGIGTYALAQTHHNPQARSQAAILKTGPGLYENPHNAYLHIAAEQGVPGLIAYLAILVSFLAYGFRALKKMRPGMRQFTLIGCMAAIAGQSIDAIANPGWMLPELAVFFWLLLGIGMRAAGLADEAEAPVQAAAAAPSGRRAAPAPAGGLRQGARLVLAGSALGLLAAHLVGLNLLHAAAAANPGKIASAGLSGTRVEGGGPPPSDVTGDSSGSGPALTAAAAGAPVALGAGSLTAVAAKGCTERFPELPDGDQPLIAARLASSGDSFAPGSRNCVFFEVLSARDNRWYSVTHRPESVLDVRYGKEWVSRVDGLINRYEMDKQIPADWAGKHVVLHGQLSRANGEPMVAEIALPVQLQPKAPQVARVEEVANAGALPPFRNAEPSGNAGAASGDKPAACCD